MTQTFQKQAGWLALALKLLSVICTGWLFFTLAGNKWIGGLTATGGVVIQWLAFLVLPLGLLWLSKGQWLRGLPAVFYGVVVFGVSTGAAVAFLEQGEQTYRKDSDRYALTNTVIELRTEAARIDIEKGWRDRALQTLNKVDAQDKERQALTSDSPLSKLAELYGWNSEQARRLAFLIFALLMDGGAILASCLVVFSPCVPEKKREQEQPETPTETGTETPEEQEQEHTSEVLEAEEVKAYFDHREQARELVKSLPTGTAVSLRFIKERLRVGNPKAKAILQELEEESLIVSCGNSYQKGE